MANGNEAMTTAAATADEFPMKIRVLAVDDDAVSLKVLEALLRRCSSRKYDVTTAMDGQTALRLLRSGKNKYDLVIIDVHMDGMDGFTLLTIIKLEMDIPVILLSADEEEASVAKGMAIGACDYLVKPVNMKELKNIWKHVVRRRIPNPRMMQPIEIAASRKRISEEDNVDDNNKNKQSSTKKNQRVTWTRDLHGRFLQAVNHIGIDRATPKKILEIMKVNYITREAVASHLQKYRKNVNKVFEGTNEYRSSSSSSNRMNSAAGVISISDDDEVEDGNDELSTCYPSNSYASILRNKLLESSKGIPGETIEDMTSTAVTMSVPMPTNKLPVQSASSSVLDMVGNCSRSWQTVVPTEINQMARVAPPSSMIPDQTTSLISNIPAPIEVLGETTLPYDMVDGNFAAVGTSSTNPVLPSIEFDSLLAPTPMRNDESVVNQPPDGEINYNYDFLADEPILDATWDELFADEDFMQFINRD